MSTEDWRSEVIAQLGPDLGEHFCQLSDEVAVAHFSWRLYRELFLDDADQRALLWQAAPGVFGWVDFFMRDHILLQMCRLTDPAKTSGKDNLTFESLKGLITDAKLTAALDVVIDDLKTHTAVARHHRNKRIAHLDKITALGAAATARLSAPSVTQIDASLGAMRRFVRTIEDHFNIAPTGYEDQFSAPVLGGPTRLTEVLKAGLDHLQQQRQRPRTRQPQGRTS